MTNAGKRRRSPKVDDCVVVCCVVAALPAGMLIAALVWAIFEAWGRHVGA